MRCNDCRFWSERVAMSIGGGPMQALCLVEGGPFSGRYTTGSHGCDKGKSNIYGAVDSPGEEEEIARLYEEDDAEIADLSRALAGAINEGLAELDQ